MKRIHFVKLLILKTVHILNLSIYIISSVGLVQTEIWT